MSLFSYIHNTLLNDIQTKIFEDNIYMLECLCKDHNLNITQINAWYTQFDEKRKNNNLTETPDPDISIIDNVPESSISSVVLTKPKASRRLQFDSSNTEEVTSKKKRCETVPKPKKDSSQAKKIIEEEHQPSIPKRRLATTRKPKIVKEKQQPIPNRRLATIPKRCCTKDEQQPIPNRRLATIPKRSIKDTKDKLTKLRYQLQEDANNDDELCNSFYPKDEEE